MVEEPKLSSLATPSMSMPRTRRRIRASNPYHLILRLKDCLAFLPWETIKLIVESALARAQRNNKVTVSHYVWMGNHPHLIIVPKDPQDCVDFYKEVQKSITESFKRLTGRKKLNLWEGDPVLAEILDLDKAIDTIAYLYGNPSRADLSNSIDDYAGLSTWKEFNKCSATLNSNVSREVPWIRQPSIPRLNSMYLSQAEDLRISSELKRSNKKTHELAIYPNAWMAAFGLSTDKAVLKVNERIRINLRQREEMDHHSRLARKVRAGTAKWLRSMPLLAPHTPKPRERKIFVLSSITELRVSFIAEMKEFCKTCAACYDLMKKGISVHWPPGAFRPSAQPLASALGW